MKEQRNEKIILDEDIELMFLGMYGYEIQIEFKASKQIPSRFNGETAIIEKQKITGSENEK